MMKAHSFIRENVPRVLTWAKDKTSMELAYYNLSLFLLFFPSVSKYTFFSSLSQLLCSLFSYVDKQSLLSSTAPSPVVPQVSQYLYFLFAPTLIYRDKYPR